MVSRVDVEQRLVHVRRRVIHFGVAAPREHRAEAGHVARVDQQVEIAQRAQRGRRIESRRQAGSLERHQGDALGNGIGRDLAKLVEQQAVAKMPLPVRLMQRVPDRGFDVHVRVRAEPAVQERRHALALGGATEVGPVERRVVRQRRGPLAEAGHRQQHGILGGEAGAVSHVTCAPRDTR